MSNSIQRSRIENLHSREVDRQSPTGLFFFTDNRQLGNFYGALNKGEVAQLCFLHRNCAVNQKQLVIRAIG